MQKVKYGNMLRVENLTLAAHRDSSSINKVRDLCEFARIMQMLYV